MKTLSIILSLFLSISICGQEITAPKEMFAEGQYFFQREDYKEALYFFSRLAQKIPGNSNYHFKIGECYLQIPGQEHLAIEHLEIAVEKIVPKREYKGRTFDENSAPLHAYFYLGNAYRINGQLDDALKAYQRFIDDPYFLKNYNLNVVEDEIFSCERAKIIQDTPIDIIKEKLYPDVNSDFSEFNALQSKKGNARIFVRGLKFYDAIFYTVKENGEWIKPININQDIISDGDYYPTALNTDGTKLLLVREKDLNSDIYISRLKEEKWTPAEKLSGKINSPAQETFASFGRNDNEIIIISDRQGGRGGKDIFISQMNEQGVWSKPKNFGKVINSETDEETAVLCNDGKTIFFSSKGHYNMGGYDIFYSNLEGDKWSVPRNVGYPVSTTRDDLFFIVDETCKSALQSTIDTDSGISEIYKITIKELLAIPQDGK